MCRRPLIHKDARCVEIHAPEISMVSAWAEPASAGALACCRRAVPTRTSPGSARTPCQRLGSYCYRVRVRVRVRVRIRVMVRVRVRAEARAGVRVAGLLEHHPGVVRSNELVEHQPHAGGGRRAPARKLVRHHLSRPAEVLVQLEKRAGHRTRRTRACCLRSRRPQRRPACRTAGVVGRFPGLCRRPRLVVDSGVFCTALIPPVVVLVRQRSGTSRRPQVRDKRVTRARRTEGRGASGEM